MQCPYIDKEIVPNPNFNERVDYPLYDGSGNFYTFYKHFDGFDKTYNCQFCTLIGRKRDVFECLNEGEWHECYAYKSRNSK